MMLARRIIIYSTDDPRLSERLAEVYSKLSEIEADRAPARAAVILHGLGFTTEMQVVAESFSWSFI